MYRVTYTPEASLELRNLRKYVFRMSRSKRVANGYIERVRDFCQTLALAPYRGEIRFPTATGLRIIGFERSITIVFRIIEDRQIVEVVGVYDHGRNPERAKERDFR